MSKRNRSSHRAQGRPGLRAAGRPATRPTPAPSPAPDAAQATVTSASATTTAAQAAMPGPSGQSAGRRSNARPSGLLARKAEDEYVYVAQDMRHIGMVLALVLVIFVILWVLIEVAHVVTY
ncbi:MAG: hypothetical protein EPN50_00945 [Chloroflexota bacterium]|nr:MAG: hypothetical protein EPN50_00945 [Chloroflexota bacterium]